MIPLLQSRSSGLIASLKDLLRQRLGRLCNSDLEDLSLMSLWLSPLTCGLTVSCNVLTGRIPVPSTPRRADSSLKNLSRSRPDVFPVGVRREERGFREEKRVGGRARSAGDAYRRGACLPVRRLKRQMQSRASPLHDFEGGCEVSAAEALGEQSAKGLCLLCVVFVCVLVVLS